MEKAIFWAVSAVVMVPVLIGLMSDEISGGLSAVLYASLWWAFFTRTKAGRKLFKKGYKIACSIMHDC